MTSERAATGVTGNRHYDVRDGHAFEPILDENGVPSGHSICNQLHDGVLCEVTQ